MLSFFRKYQKAIFLFTTILVVISFVFFGTYNKSTAFGKRETHDELLYVALQGRKITRSYLEQMQRFLELEPAFSYDPARVIQSNPLNDGVITREFLIQDFAPFLLSDEGKGILEQKFVQEKNFTPYHHPTSKALSALATWELFAPELNEHFLKLKGCDNGLADEAMAARVALYLAHQRFNGDMLKQVLRYKEYQEGVTVDPLLANKELSLFGYRTLGDWFGAPFIERAAKVIIQGAQLAKVRGLKVAKGEVHADIYERVQRSFSAIQQRVQLPARNSQEFLQLLLTRLQMEESELMQIWEDVLYFRRLLDEGSGAVMVDQLALKKFYDFAHHTLNVKVVEMGQELYLPTVKALQGFELYLESVGEGRESLLMLPSRYKAAEKVALEAPELTGRRFWVEVAHLNKRELSSKVPLTTLWAWQERHYGELQEHFGLPAWSQFDSIDEKLRERVDHYSYTLLVEEHPEWIAEVLATKPKKQQELFICFKQKRGVLLGIEDGAALSEHLSKEESLSCYTQDGQNYYAIGVTQRGLLGEVLSYNEAKRLGALEELVERKDGEYLVQKVLAAVRTSLEKHGVASPKEGIEAFCVQHRFYNYLQQVRADPNYREGFDASYAPQIRYKSVGRQERHFEELLRSRGKCFSWEQDKGLTSFEIEDDLTEAAVPLERLYMLHQFASKDVRRELIKEIVNSL